MKKTPPFRWGYFLCPKTPKGVRLAVRKFANIELQKGTRTMKFEFSQGYMGIEDCPLEKWLETHKQQLNSWIYRVYAQGYKDALNDIRKDCDGNVSDEL